MWKRNFLSIKALIVLLAFLMVITGLVTETVFAKENKTVVMLRWRFKDRSEEAFEKVLNASGFEINWQDYCADEKKDKLVEIIKGLDTSKIDLIYSFGTTVSQVLKDMIKDVPIVYCIVSDPVGAGVVARWEHSGNNFTGASNAVPVEAQLKALKRILNFKRLGMIHNPKEGNSVMWKDQAKALEKDFDFTLVTADFTTKDDLDSAMRTLADQKVDAVWLPAVSAIKANQDILLTAINDKKLPSITAMTDLAKRKDKDSALIGLGPDYYKLGELAGQKALQIFAGKKPTDIPSETLKSFDLIINTKTAEKIGMKIPLGILKTATEVVK